MLLITAAVADGALRVAALIDIQRLAGQSDPGPEGHPGPRTIVLNDAPLDALERKPGTPPQCRVSVMVAARD